jgi:GH24 family phage-related lysozyme (muramidase)
MQRRFLLGVCFVFVLTTAASGVIGPAPRRAEANVEPPPKHINQAGISIIKDNEKLKLKSYAFGGRWYIGYGHLTKGPGHYITAEIADKLLRKDLKICEEAVRESVEEAVTTEEFSAMTALCYNIGAPNFRATSVLERLNNGDHEGAADAFLLLTKADVNGKMKTLTALEERRKSERALFLSGGRPERTAEASLSE